MLFICTWGDVWTTTIEAAAKKTAPAPAQAATYAAGQEGNCGAAWAVTALASQPWSPRPSSRCISSAPSGAFRYMQNCIRRNFRSSIKRPSVDFNIRVSVFLFPRRAAWDTARQCPRWLGGPFRTAAGRPPGLPVPVRAAAFEVHGTLIHRSAWRPLSSEFSLPSADS